MGSPGPRASYIFLFLVAACFIACAKASLDEFCVNVPNGRFVGNPRSCQHWIFCSNARATEGQCNGIFYFDEPMQLCRYPTYVDCPFGGVDFTCPSMDFELHPHPNECEKYVACIEGVPRVINCAPNLHWNAKTSQCDFPINANCNLQVRTIFFIYLGFIFNVNNGYF